MTKKLEPDLTKGITALPAFPIVLITVGRNIMTAGAFHFFSFDPPSVMVGIMPDKYSYELLNQEGEFGINIPRMNQIDVVRLCGSVSGRDGADKYAEAGVTRMAGTAIKGDLVKECPVNLECVVVHKIGFKGSHQWFVGEIKAVHIDDDYERDQALMFWGGSYRRVGAFLEGVRA
jgi:flavin reductase (DIM6/NTAB) family NADH-FMN oxidoreductase RutF